MSDDTKTRKATFLPQRQTPDGNVDGLFFEKDGSVLEATISPVREGTPIHGDVAVFTQREGSPLLDAEITQSDKSRRGYTAAYGRGWERIFGNNAEVGEA